MTIGAQCGACMCAIELENLVKFGPLDGAMIGDQPQVRRVMESE